MASVGAGLADRDAVAAVAHTAAAPYRAHHARGASDRRCTGGGDGHGVDGGPSAGDAATPRRPFLGTTALCGGTIYDKRHHGGGGRPGHNALRPRMAYGTGT